VLQQALRDISAWAEKGKAPPESTRYTIVDGQVQIPASAAERKGIQPVVELEVNGGKRVEIQAGQIVTFKGSISVPPGAGYVTAAEWDFDGKGAFPDSSPVPAHSRTITVTTTHRFDMPGTHFISLRGTSQRQGDRKTPYTCILNLDRVRVVVR
jgi:hypothetical protein